MLKNLFGSGSSNGRGNDFVGQYVELGKQKLRIRRVLGEGGYGFVFAAQDTTTGKEYALKRLMAGDDGVKQEIMQEINVLKKLKGHHNIIKFIAAASSGNEQMSHGMTEFLILTELCSGGQLIDLLKESYPKPLNFNQMFKAFTQTCMAVSNMHKQEPPVIHRDLKIENLLFSAKGFIKLCDFGSSTTKALHPNEDWTALQRSLAEDEDSAAEVVHKIFGNVKNIQSQASCLFIQKNTTPMYRAPEMIDLYSNYPVTTKADVWALGCILYYLCYMEHPFADGAKLKILNAKYTVPEDPRNVSDLQPLIDSILQVDPDERPTVDDIIFELQSVATARAIDPTSPVLADRSRVSQDTESSAYNAAVSSGSGVGGSAILGNVVKSAGFLFSNIKDVSSKVVQSVAGYVRNDLDISYITGKIVVMSFPAEGIESAYKNSIDDVRVYFDTKHPDRYVIMNISQRQYNVSKLNDRVFESGWNARKAPSLSQLISLCRKAYNFLRQDRDNVVAIHCLDGKTSSAIMVSALLVFCKLFNNPSMALDMFSLRRCQPGQKIDLNPSQRRYLNYVTQLVSDSRVIPHKKPLFLKTVTVSPIPLFNKAKTGCRPFIEIFQGEQRILSTAIEIEQMRAYVVSDRRVDFNVNTKLYGDVTIIVYHARSTFGGKVQGKLTSFNIFTVQFHTGFVEDGAAKIQFTRAELDLADADDQKYPPTFSVSMDVVLGAETQGIQKYTEPWDQLSIAKLVPNSCFRSKEDYWACREEFGLGEERSVADKEALNASREGLDSEHEKKVGRSTFFDSLDWNEDGVSCANGNAATVNPSQPANKHTFCSDFAALHQHARPAIARLSGSESEGSQEDSNEWRNEQVSPPANAAPLIDIGLSFDDDATQSNKVNSATSSKDLFSNYFDEDFANFRSTTNQPDPSAESQNTGSQNIFNDDFSALKIETNLDTRPSPSETRPNLNVKSDIDTKSNLDTRANDIVNNPAQRVHKSGDQNNFGLLLNLGTTEATNTDKNVLKSPSTPNFPSAVAAENVLIDTSDPFMGGKTTRSPSLKKNLSTNDISEKHSEDDFFNALSDRHTSPGDVSAHNSFSITDENVIDPFSVKDDSNSFLSTFSSSSSSPMRHSSSDGDLLGDWGQSHAAEPTLKPTSATSGGLHKSASSASDIGRPQNQPKSNDPFDFVNLSGGGFAAKPPQNPAPSSSGNFTFGAAQPQNSSSSFGSSSTFSQAPPQMTSQTKQNVPKNMGPTQPAPNYYVGKAFAGKSVFGSSQRGGLGGSWGSRPAARNEFSDILGAHGFKPSSEQQRETLGQLKKQTDTQDMDPIKAKIREWADGKERNIRTLLCSLHTVLWEGESRWKPCDMHQLLKPNDVKKFYKRACLAVHPDKLTGTPEEDLARAIFIELSEAWSLFVESGSKSLF